jgi:hypothetical protein
MDEASYAYADEINPTEGDYSMCLACGHIAVFNADLSLREPTPMEAEAIKKNPHVNHAQFGRSYMVGDQIKKRDHLT